MPWRIRFKLSYQVTNGYFLHYLDQPKAEETLSYILLESNLVEILFLFSLLTSFSFYIFVEVTLDCPNWT